VGAPKQRCTFTVETICWTEERDNLSFRTNTSWTNPAFPGLSTRSNTNTPDIERLSFGRLEPDQTFVSLFIIKSHQQSSGDRLTKRTNSPQARSLKGGPIGSLLKLLIHHHSLCEFFYIFYFSYKMYFWGIKWSRVFLLGPFRLQACGKNVDVPQIVWSTQPWGHVVSNVHV
jgi:hypothetical protein